MTDTSLSFDALPKRVLLDTCILNHLYDEGSYIFDGGSLTEACKSPEQIADLRNFALVNQRASFQLLVSPLTVAEVANIQSLGARRQMLSWVLEMLDHWLILLDDSGSRVADGGDVRHRFKLTEELQTLEARLMMIPDLRRDPFDRLLLLQYKMANCSAFLTTDENTVARHKIALDELGIRVLSPKDYWNLLRPWAGLWI